MSPPTPPPPVPNETMPVTKAVANLVERIRSYQAPTAIVAFSGGVDSSVVLAMAARTLTPLAVRAITAVSPSYPAGELAIARQTAAFLCVKHSTIETHEVEEEKYARNGPTRCYHCKTELYKELQPIIQRAAGSQAVLLSGTNVDDLLDFRPGLLAASKARVRSPLSEEGFGKVMTREIARFLGLQVAEKPALSCLASRVKYGLRITPQLLHQIDRAEQIIRALDIEPVRVRHLGDRAQVEVPFALLTRLVQHPDLESALAAIRELGWPRVDINPNGLRSGSMNAEVSESPAIRRALVRIRSLAPSNG